MRASFPAFVAVVLTAVPSAGCSCESTSTPGSDASIPRIDSGPRPDGGTIEWGPTSFRRGVNPGYYGPGIDRRESAEMSVAAGANSMRTPLPERYLAQWGDAIEVEDYAHYRSIGIDHLVVFLIGPSREHSSAPDTAADWELEHYAPRNLYEPIFLADGSVNPENYWAAYVDAVARNYGDHIDVYEVWNEPDQVLSNWPVTIEWEDRAPAASELPWWNDTIFAYVRALRITHEVVHRVDPSAAVTLGGVGYPSFLDAVLRYSDEPTSGAIDAEHPSTGAAYLDVISYHYYPVFGGGSSDRGVDGMLEARDQLAARLDEADAGDRDFVITESGAPRYALGEAPGGAVYSASYLVKAMTLGHFEGLIGIDWFAQGDGAIEGASDDPFEYMGLYESYSSATTVAETTVSVQGRAYAWVAEWLEGLAADRDALSALALPDSVRGAAFHREGGGTITVLWARTEGDESATARYSLAAEGEVTVRSFSTDSGGSVETRGPVAGVVELELGSMPIVVEAP